MVYYGKTKPLQVNILAFTSRVKVIMYATVQPAGRVLPSKKVIGLVVFLDIPGTGG